MAREKVILDVEANTGGANKSLEKVQKTTKDTSNAAKDAASQFTIMGVSIGGLKSSFAKVIPIAKGLFGTIKAGIASTGIGVLVLAIAALVSNFTNTKKGAEQLQVAFKAVGTAIDVLKDRISKIGGAIVKVFKGDFKGAAEDAKAAVTDLGKEIVQETKAAIRLTQALQKITDAEREFSIQKAKTAQEIQKARFEAMDENKTLDERLEALQKAADLEIETTNEAIRLQKEKLAARQEEVDLGESLAEDFDELAQLEVELINLQTQSFSTRKRLAAEIETLTREQAALDKAAAKEKADAEKLAADEKKKQQEEEAKAQKEINDNRLKLQQELNLQLIEDDTQRAIATRELQAEKMLAETTDAETKKIIEQKLALDIQAINDAANAQELANEQALQAQKEAVALSTLGSLKGLLGEQSAAGKAVAVVEATLNMYKGVSAAIGSAPPPFNIISAATTAAVGLKTINDIVAVQPPQFAAGGIVGGLGTGTSDSVSARLSKGESVINARSTRMFKPLLSAINEAGGGRAFATGDGTGGNTTGVVKAFVVADDMTKQQDKMTKIRRKATI